MNAADAFDNFRFSFIEYPDFGILTTWREQIPIAWADINPVCRGYKA